MVVSDWMNGKNWRTTVYRINVTRLKWAQQIARSLVRRRMMAFRFLQERKLTFFSPSFLLIHVSVSALLNCCNSVEYKKARRSEKKGRGKEVIILFHVRYVHMSIPAAGDTWKDKIESTAPSYASRHNRYFGHSWRSNHVN